MADFCKFQKRIFYFDLIFPRYGPKPEGGCYVTFILEIVMIMVAVMTRGTRMMMATRTATTMTTTMMLMMMTPAASEGCNIIRIHVYLTENSNRRGLKNCWQILPGPPLLSPWNLSPLTRAPSLTLLSSLHPRWTVPPGPPPSAKPRKRTNGKVLLGNIG